MSWEGARRYMTHDCDAHCVELVVLPPMGNGDWYVSIVREGHKLARLATVDGEEPYDAPPSCVRITTSGERREHRHVARAIAALYQAFGGEDPDAGREHVAAVGRSLAGALLDVREKVQALRNKAVTDRALAPVAGDATRIATLNEVLAILDGKDTP